MDEAVRAVRVLLVEDEALVAMEMENLLLANGHDVVGVADSYESAVSVADADKPDLALVDIQLADRSCGLEVAAALSARGVPCLFVTGNCPADQGRGLALGCLHKPFNDRGLLAAMAAVRQLLMGRAPAQLPRGLHVYA